MSFIVSSGFGVTETCAGCINDPVDLVTTKSKHEFLDLGRPIGSCEMRITDSEDGKSVCANGESSILFVCYYNNTGDVWALSRTVCAP